MTPDPITPLQKRPKKQLSGGRMLQQRNDELPVPIESRGPPDDGHHAICPRQFEQTFNVLIRHPLRQRAKRQLRIEFVFQALPFALVLA